jgi:hypothetical protein
VSILNDMQSRCLIVTPDVVRQLMLNKEKKEDGQATEQGAGENDDDALIKVHTLKSSSLIRFLMYEAQNSASKQHQQQQPTMSKIVECDSQLSESGCNDVDLSQTSKEKYEKPTSVTTEPIGKCHSIAELQGIYFNQKAHFARLSFHFLHRDV